MGATLSRTLGRGRSRYVPIADSESFADLGTFDVPVCGRDLSGGIVGEEDGVIDELECQQASLDNLSAIGQAVPRNLPCTDRVISRVHAGGASDLTVCVEPASALEQPEFAMIESGESDTSLEQSATPENSDIPSSEVCDTRQEGTLIAISEEST